jgi:hypothetical protein
MQASERDLHGLPVLEPATQKTALTLSLTRSAHASPSTTIDLIRSSSSLTRYRTTSSTSSLAAEPALACKVRTRGCSSQRLQLGAHITLKHDIITSCPSLHWRHHHCTAYIITCTVTSFLLRTGEPRACRDVVYLSLLSFLPQTFLLPSTTTQLLHLHPPSPSNTQPTLLGNTTIIPFDHHHHHHY